MITIVDYGMGNLGSIANMLRRVGAASVTTGHPRAIRQASKLLLPGVGHFDKAMRCIDDRGLREVLDEKVLDEKVPVLGICLGMQLLTNGSEEGTLPGLGWIEAETVRFPPQDDLKVPHMGWNLVEPQQPSPILNGIDSSSRFYFVHSYFVKPDHERDILTTTHYGVEFASAVQRDNVTGAQFHPEKSHRFGMQLLRNFAEA